MKARDIVGKRVVAVGQVRRTANSGKSYYSVGAIEFEEGTLFLTVTNNDDNDPEPSGIRGRWLPKGRERE